mgnify:CR=1 FL=1
MIPYQPYSHGNSASASPQLSPLGSLSVALADCPPSPLPPVPLCIASPLPLPPLVLSAGAERELTASSVVGPEQTRGHGRQCALQLPHGLQPVAHGHEACHFALGPAGL